ncbi:YkgJ family cysteine cluster protein [Candidatus Bathyarchaeota archaeon]|nr:MAG: YkgJ family cysteine cluster protein [Candidatus Bathyarchaeota archaeon]
MRVLDGKLCLIMKCSKCCINTEMIISYYDILQILHAGFSLSDFAYYDGRYWRLRNKNGRCVFLDEEGLCTIYDMRPIGCRAYPIIIVETEASTKCDVDSICPFSFAITENELHEGCKLLKILFKQLGEKIL